MAKKQKNSIVQNNLTECLVCCTTRNIHIHHVFFGTANRKQSDKYGCIVALCQEHHTGNSGVHHNKELDTYIKQLAQKQFESQHGTREDFMQAFGKNYL